MTSPTRERLAKIIWDCVYRWKNDAQMRADTLDAVDAIIASGLVRTGEVPEAAAAADDPDPKYTAYLDRNVADLQDYHEAKAYAARLIIHLGYKPQDRLAHMVTQLDSVIASLKPPSSGEVPEGVEKRARDLHQAIKTLASVNVDGALHLIQQALTLTRNETIDECAKWHDKCAKEYRSMSQHNEADRHEVYAAALRSRKG